MNKYQRRVVSVGFLIAAGCIFGSAFYGAVPVLLTGVTAVAVFIATLIGSDL